MIMTTTTTMLQLQLNCSYICVLCCALTVITVACAQPTKQPITEICLGCMCEALSGCNSSAICVSGACGIFRITWDQWVDSGRFTVEGDTALSDDAFPNCVNNPRCAADTLQAYMVRYGQDCNGDQQEDCYDYGAIHYMGPFNCQAEMPYNYESNFKKCLARHLQQQQQMQSPKESN